MLSMVRFSKYSQISSFVQVNRITKNTFSLEITGHLCLRYAACHVSGMFAVCVQLA